MTVKPINRRFWGIATSQVVFNFPLEIESAIRKTTTDSSSMVR